VDEVLLIHSIVSVVNSTLTVIGSVNIFTTGQLASVLLHIASNSCFLALAATLTLSTTSLISGLSSFLVASVVTSILSRSILLCFATLAKIVAAQSARAMIANSIAVGPLSSPPLEGGRSQTIVCVRELSTAVRIFSKSFAVVTIFGI